MLGGFIGRVRSAVEILDLGPSGGGGEGGCWKGGMMSLLGPSRVVGLSFVSDGVRTISS